jgi:two-component system chemotaxis sensor kinase CheA
MSEISIKEIFLEEAKEILEQVEADVVSLEENFNPELLNVIFRHVHTLKGSSGIAGFDEVYEFNHKLENLMDLIRSGKLNITSEIIDVLLQSFDWTKLFLFGDDNTSKEQLDQIKEVLLEHIDVYVKTPSLTTSQSGNEAVSPKTPFNYFRIKADFKENIFEHGIDPLMIMQDLLSLGTVIYKNVDRSKLPEFEDMDPEKCYLSWKLILKTEHSRQKVDDIFLFVKEDNDIVVEDITAGYEEEGEAYITERKIGEILVKKGIITETELSEVIQSQEKENRKLGDIVVDKGFATEHEIMNALNEQDKIRKKVDTGTVRVDTNKMDNLMNLLGEIVIGQSSIARIADDLDDEMAFRMKNALHALDRTTREFQEQIMSIRMIPVGPSFEQFLRFVRDAAHSEGKEIRLEMEGKETELDKTVIEKIGDPLKHMIRNAIDHAIETPEERVAAGKERTGHIWLRAYHQEGNVFIEISDDGRGINKKKLHEKAVKKELILPDEEVSDSRLLSFIFLPGFSTAAQVGELSGRGVGMDVVKTNIEALRGSVEIETEEGKGTTFRIKLPLTLAIIDGMLVRVGKNTYIIPLLSIMETIQAREEDIKTIEGKGEVVIAREEYISLVRTYKHFGIEADHTDPWEALQVIVESSGEKVALMVDDLLGQQQTVIKSLDKVITESRSISGAAILGDGSIALIIDIHGLISEIKNK